MRGAAADERVAAQVANDTFVLNTELGLQVAAHASVVQAEGHNKVQEGANEAAVTDAAAVLVCPTRTQGMM